MKTFRMSESSHRRNASKALSVFAHAGTPAASDIHAEAPLRGRNFRRANGLSHPFFLERYTIHQSTEASYCRLLDDLHCSSSKLPNNTTVPLVNVLRAISGRLKPWGPVFGAMLKSNVAYTIGPGSRPLVRRVRILNTDVNRLVSLTFDPAAPVRLTFATMMSKLDAMETLNLAYRQGTELLASVPTTKGSRVKSLDVNYVLTLAKRFISPSEIAARTGKNSTTIYAAGVRAGLDVSSRAGFRRDEAERFFFP